MNGPRVYLHALGLINALGDGIDSIVPALAAGVSPGMGTIHTGIGDAFAGSVIVPLDLAPRNHSRVMTAAITGCCSRRLPRSRRR